MAAHHDIGTMIAIGILASSFVVGGPDLEAQAMQFRLEAIIAEQNRSPGRTEHLPVFAGPTESPLYYHS
ncbi:hypothetical protein BZA05DRAFT_448207 [Tricharina praecox]|uniref:uncharacterized protein n=1 Tax=Tricharina praecox TaxID=43433 RepID=UPI0022207355|nr:uncharacterized protein BZA05DRAFT_448207 [Tricharina praecox]KAI5844715.1 hypothetical protein BZA05DRAFT_448207 [Tricharina praecox]